jgi:hypothetical protein
MTEKDSIAESICRTGNWTEEREKALEKLNQMDIDELVDYIHRNTKGPQEGQEVIK